MPLSPEQLKELEELEELEQLEKVYGQKQLQASQELSMVDKIRQLLGQPTGEAFHAAQKQYRDTHPEPVTGMEDPVYQALGFATGSNPTAGVGSSLRKLGDFLMQRGMGASRLVPGLGEKFAAEGMIGTKNMLAKQAARGLETSGNKIGELASQIPGTISQDQVANKVAEIANAKMTPTGFVRPEDKAVVDKVLSRATDFAKSEALEPAEMAARRAQAGKAAREAGAYKMNPSSQVKSKVAAAEQAGYSQALKDAYSKAFPGQPNALANADQSYSTFKQAQDLLSIPEAVGSVRGFADQFIPSTLLETAAGRAAIGTGKAVQRIPKTAPISLQEMLRPKRDNR